MRSIDGAGGAAILGGHGEELGASARPRLGMSGTPRFIEGHACRDALRQRRPNPTDTLQARERAEWTVRAPVLDYAPGQRGADAGERLDFRRGRRLEIDDRPRRLGQRTRGTRGTRGTRRRRAASRLRRQSFGRKGAVRRPLGPDFSLLHLRRRGRRWAPLLRALGLGGGTPAGGANAGKLRVERRDGRSASAPSGQSSRRVRRRGRAHAEAGGDDQEQDERSAVRGGGRGGHGSNMPANAPSLLIILLRTVPIARADRRRRGPSIAAATPKPRRRRS